MVLAIAAKTGWSEDYIRFELTWARAVQYHLGATIMDSVHYWTVAPGFGDANSGTSSAPIIDQLDALDALDSIGDLDPLAFALAD